MAGPRFQPFPLGLLRDRAGIPGRNPSPVLPGLGALRGRNPSAGLAAGWGFLGPEGWGFPEADSVPQKMATYLGLASIVA